jgi:hypothetical protein
VTIQNYEATANYVYEAGDYAAAYSNNNNPGGGGPVSELTRQMVFLRPGEVVVFDRVTTLQPQFTKAVQWNFLHAPVVHGNAFTATQGQSKLFGATFSTVPLTTTAAAVNDAGAKVQELDVRNAVPAASVRYVTALQTAPSTAAAMVTTNQVVTTDGRMQGVEMGSQVVLFGTNGAVNLARGVTYTATGNGIVNHLLTNLTADQTYHVLVNGALAATVTASAQGTLSFATKLAGKATIQVVI